MKTISVLIPTVGRKKELIDTLEALTKQTRIPDEIIVVDQNHPPFQEVEHLLAQIPYAKHILSPQKGVVPNYNRALESARSEIVLYIDDDVIPDPQLLEKHLSSYECSAGMSPPLGCVAGRIIELGKSREKLRNYKPNKAGRYSYWSGKVVGNFGSTKPGNAEFGQGANLSFLREALLKVGGFDPAFDGNGYFFEPDGGLRIRRAGYQVLYNPEATLVHLMAPSGGARVHNKSLHTYYFVKNGILLYRRHSPKIGLPYFILKMLGYVFVKGLYNFQPRIFFKGLRALRDGLRQPLVFRAKKDVPGKNG